jgi:hypothetical protein
MDQAYTKALAALQPFVHLAATTKSPSHRFLADLITRATSAPGTYVFTELLQLSSIQSLRAEDTPAEYRAYLTLLEIFSWGTYEEYKSTLPTLTPELASNKCRHTRPSHPERGPDTQTPTAFPPHYRLPVPANNYLRQYPHLPLTPLRPPPLHALCARVPRHILHLLQPPHRSPLPGLHPAYSPHPLRRSPPGPPPPIPPRLAAVPLHMVLAL